MKKLLIAALILLSQTAQANELNVPYNPPVQPRYLSDSVGKWTAINNAQQQEQRAQQQFERDQQPQSSGGSRSVSLENTKYQHFQQMQQLQREQQEFERQQEQQRQYEEQLRHNQIMEKIGNLK